MFEGFPSTSFPTTRWLFIVAATDAARYEHLVRLLRDVAGVTVILDRRRGDRRHGDHPPARERRQLERRVRRVYWNSLGYALVRFAVKPPAKSHHTGDTSRGFPTLTPP
jgi:hypothetical protein